jgi:prepilin-type processing-associated H-X9-DG protein
MPYVKSKGIFSNPSNSESLYYASGYWKPGATSATDTNTANFFRVTVTYNHLLSHGDFPPDAPGAASLTGVNEPADTVMLGPSQNWFSWSSCQDNGQGGRNLAWNVSTGGWGYELWGGPKGGFNEGANFSYVDGHAQYAKVSQGGDIAEGNVGTLYMAYFPKAKNKPNVSADTTCPANKPEQAF